MIMRNLRLLAYFSLIYGGFLVITYLAFAYSAIWRHEFLPIFPDSRRDSFTNATEPFGANLSLGRPFRPREAFPENAITQVVSLQALAILFTGLAFLVNGYTLFKYLRQKEKKETKNFVVSSLLTGDEQLIYGLLVKNGGEATQKQLSTNAGFSAVKAYRVLQRLENKKVVNSFPFGMTKKIILNED
jgi:uncharacterized membrane protein